MNFWQTSIGTRFRGEMIGVLASQVGEEHPATLASTVWPAKPGREEAAALSGRGKREKRPKAQKPATDYGRGLWRYLVGQRKFFKRDGLARPPYFDAYRLNGPMVWSKWQQCRIAARRLRLDRRHNGRADVGRCQGNGTECETHARGRSRRCSLIAAHSSS